MRPGGRLLRRNRSAQLCTSLLQSGRRETRAQRTVRHALERYVPRDHHLVNVDPHAMNRHDGRTTGRTRVRVWVCACFKTCRTRHWEPHAGIMAGREGALHPLNRIGAARPPLEVHGSVSNLPCLCANHRWGCHTTHVHTKVRPHNLGTAQSRSVPLCEVFHVGGSAQSHTDRRRTDPFQGVHRRRVDQPVTWREVAAHDGNRRGGHTCTRVGSVVCGSYLLKCRTVLRSPRV